MAGCGEMITREQACHSTLPFENLRVLSIVEGLMALSKTLSEVEGSRIEGLVWRVYDPHIAMSERFILLHPVDPVNPV
jgi:hypothetical protein